MGTSSWAFGLDHEGMTLFGLNHKEREMGIPCGPLGWASDKFMAFGFDFENLFGNMTLEWGFARKMPDHWIVKDNRYL